MAMSPSVSKIDAICAKLKTTCNKTQPALNDDHHFSLDNGHNLSEDFPQMQADWMLNKQRNRRKASAPRSIFHMLEPSDDKILSDEYTDIERDMEPQEVDHEDIGSETSEHYDYKFLRDSDKDVEPTGKEALSLSPEDRMSVDSILLLPQDKEQTERPIRLNSQLECTPEAAPLDLSLNKCKTEQPEVTFSLPLNIPENTSSSSSVSSSSSSCSCPESQTSDIPSQPPPYVGIPLSVPTNSISKRTLNKRVRKLYHHTNGGNIVALKDYAETTMKELLNLYGLSEGQELPGQTIPRQPIPVSSALLKITNHSESPVLPHATKKSVEPMVSSDTLEKTSESPLSVPPQPYTSTAPALTLFNQEDCEKKFLTNHKISTNIVKLVQAVPSSISSTNYIPGSLSYMTKANFIPTSATCKISPNHDRIGIRKVMNTDYTKYLKRFSNSAECGMAHCKEMHYREHYHCLDCSFKIFSKKEEMVRHFKWHKKRDDSLQYGFMRYSPLDDCSFTYPNCPHNRRQTHYHCLQQLCDKVYISTSDVQMHANYHRKDSAIIQEGFQRFRATENCGSLTCSFNGQRTTHFHCRRSDCKFTFKNKADMEKHKSYHQKDELLGRDGFKKFMKYEHCKFPQCRFSKVSNHIHCIRPDCNYILHSTAQLYSHKRKHERRDFENAYRRFQEVRRNKTVQIPNNYPKLLAAQSGNSQNIKTPPTLPLPKEHPQLLLKSNLEENTVSNDKPIKCESLDDEDEINETKVKKEIFENEDPDETNGSSISFPTPNSSQEDVAIKTENSSPPTSILMSQASDLAGDSLNDSLSLPIPSSGIKTEMFDNHIILNVHNSSASNSLLSPPGTPKVMEKKEKDENWKAYLIRYTANDPCNPRCDLLYKDHYHCQVSGCGMTYRSKDGVREHARFHELQDRVSSMSYVLYEENEACPEKCQFNLKSKHYHCKWPGCNLSIPHSSDVFARLEHYHMHHNSQIVSSKFLKYPLIKSEIDIAKPRRGRPPKYPRLDIPLISKVQSMPGEFLGTFNEDNASMSSQSPSELTPEENFKMYREKEACPDEDCMYLMKEHYHCPKPRCHHATDQLDVLSLHTKDFHSFVNILEGFEFFDHNVDCHQAQCQNNKINKHFHCTRCDYTFIRHNTMIPHDKKHREKLDLSPMSKHAITSFVPIMPAVSKIALQPTSKAVIKSSGTFYPISTIPTCQARPLTSLVQQESHVNSNQIGNPSIVNMPGMFSSSIGTMGTSLVSTSQSSLNGSNALPLLLQQKVENASLHPNWASIKEKMRYSIYQNCGRPFCKLKKRDHYHCLQCNQAFSEPSRLQYHMSKHGLKFHDISFVPENMVLEDISSNKYTDSHIREMNEAVDSLEEEEDKGEEEESKDSNDDLLIPGGGGAISNKSHGIKNMPSFLIGLPNFNAVMKGNNMTTVTNCFSSQQTKMPLLSSPEPKEDFKTSEDENILDSKREESFPMSQKSILSAELNLVRKRLAESQELESVESPSLKIRCLTSGSVPGIGERMPDGYIRVKYSEDCRYAKCTYKHMVTHFHCQRPDCGYGFSDRSRIVQHKLRHERIDSITGCDFKQFRANVNCEYKCCEYNSKSSHYHCLKCDFVCTDTTKVTAHRKFHVKMENIAFHGFQKYLSNDQCNFPSCNYNKKQTHYHCMQENCNYTVLGLSQMTTHKFKHIAESADVY